MLKKIGKFALFMLLALTPMTLQAQGIILGRVVAKTDEEPLLGVTVILLELKKVVSTDVDGRFMIPNVPKGTYSMSLRYVSYNTIQKSDIVVSDSGEIYLDFVMEPANIQLANVEILATRRVNTDLAMIRNTKEAATVINAVSAQQIAKTMDRDVGEVVKRVPGVTIMDNRFVVIRGLNHRYNNVWLNQVSAPSGEADSKSFSFDAIPSGMIDNLMLYKTPSPEIPADFSGGFVSIATKGMPSEKQVSLSFSTGYQSGSTFLPFTSVSRTVADWFGLGSAARSIPEAVPSKIKFSQPVEARVRYTALMNDGWDHRQMTALPDLRMSAVYQEVFKSDSWRLGQISALNYGNTFKINEIENRRFGIYQQTVDAPHTKNDYEDVQNTQDSKWGLLSNWTLELDKSKFEFKNFFNQIGKSRYTLRNGVDNNNGYIQRDVEHFYSSRSVFSSQLSGKKQYEDLSKKWDWTLGYSYANRSEPDRKIITYRLNTDSTSAGFNQYRTFGNDIRRYFQDLQEHVVSGGSNWEQQIKLGSIKPLLKAGVFSELKYRSFDARSFVYELNGNHLPSGYTYFNITDLMREDNVQNQGVLIKENSNKSDSYTASSQLYAGYVGLNVPVNEKTKAYVGFRTEYNHLNLDGYESDGTDPVNIDRFSLRLFPSINLGYNLDDNHILRLAYGMTVNRPEFRELAPYVYYDFEQFSNVEGNISLKDAQIQNVDLRYEWYPTPSELFSLALFGKFFKHPIENTYFEVGGQNQFTFKNAQSASNFGVEMDVKKNLSFIGLEHFNMVMNAAFINSRVHFDANSIERNRAMQGQSPYLVNLGLYYEDSEKGIKVNTMYNRIGKRIVSVGVVAQNPIEDIPDTYEMPRNVLDLNLTKSFGEKIELSLNVRDLLGEAASLKQFPMYESNGKRLKREQVVRKYVSGQNVSVQLKCIL